MDGKKFGLVFVILFTLSTHYKYYFISSISCQWTSTWIVKQVISHCKTEHRIRFTLPFFSFLRSLMIYKQPPFVLNTIWTISKQRKLINKYICQWAPICWFSCFTAHLCFSFYLNLHWLVPYYCNRV